MEPHMQKMTLWQKSMIVLAAITDRRTSLWAKATIAGALLYGVSPVDLIPDLLPLLGITDDIGICIVAIIAFIRMTKHVRATMERENITKRNDL